MLRTLPLFALALTLLAAAPAAERRPNIVFLFADDQRFDTLSCAGHPIVRTPAIDRLAADGVRFNNAFVTTSVCWVSRAVVLTGQTVRSHMMRTSVPTVRPEALRTMYPLPLREAGYRTGYFGKWHLMSPPGFDPAAQYDRYEAIGRNPYFKTLPDGTKRHETDLVADRGVAFIAEQTKDRPFFLNLCFNASHAEDNDRRPGIGHYPWPPSVDGMYEDVTIPPPRLGDPALYEKHPDFLKASINRERFFWGYDTPEKYQTNLRAYFRMISGIDHAVGRVVAALEAAGLADNTIIVYSADNGYYLGDRGFQGKWSHYEESLRVPLVIHDPRLPKGQRGRVVDAMALNLDLPATFLDWAGVTAPAVYEGRSLRPLVQERTVPADWRQHFFAETRRPGTHAHVGRHPRRPLRLRAVFRPEPGLRISPRPQGGSGPAQEFRRRPRARGNPQGHARALRPRDRHPRRPAPANRRARPPQGGQGQERRRKEIARPGP